MVIEDHPADISGFKPGHVVAGYRLETKVGQGGMAVVYRARDERLHRQVALKILAPALAEDTAFRRRFIGESDAIAAVDHPHIIPVYDCGEADGVLYIAMRFVPTGDLRRLMRREGRMPPSRVAEIISPVASALDAAHNARLIHRDVKPGNILVDTGPGRPDYVLLSDFGVSKSVATSVTITGTGQFIGTAGYAAPEQIQELGVDGRADQYALACVAYELFTGEPLFQRPSIYWLLIAHVHEQPPLLTSRRPDLPVAADRVMAKALAKGPAERYPTCTGFAEALRGAFGLPPYYAADVAIPPGEVAPPPGEVAPPPGEEAPPPLAPGPRPSTAEVPVLDPPPSEPSSTAVDQTEIPAPPQPSTITIQGSAPRTELPASVDGPTSAPASAEPPEAAELTAATPDTPALATEALDNPADETATAVAADTPADTPDAPADTPVDTPDAPAVEANPPVNPPVEGPAAVALEALADAPEALAETPEVLADAPRAGSGYPGVPGDGTAVPAPAMNRRRRLALVAGAAVIIGLAVAIAFLLEPAAGNSHAQGAPTLSPEPTLPTSTASSSPASTGTPTASTGTPQRTQLRLPASFTKQFTGYPGQISSVAVNPSGTTLAIAGINETCLWNLTHGGCTVIAASAWAVAFGPDGKTVVGVNSANGIVRLSSTVTGRQVRSVPAIPGSAGALSVAVSPDGNAVAVGDQNGHAYLLDLATDQWTQLPSPAGGEMNAVAFNPSGTELAGGDANGDTYLWNVATRQAVATLPGPTGGGGVQAVAFSDNGEWLATGNSNGSTYLWNAVKDTLTSRLSESGGQDVLAVAFSPDSKTLAVGENNGTVYLWKLSNRTLTGELANPQAEGVETLAFGQNGKVLVTGNYNGTVDSWSIG